MTNTLATQPPLEHDVIHERHRPTNNASLMGQCVCFYTVRTIGIQHNIKIIINTFKNILSELGPVDVTLSGLKILPLVLDESLKMHTMFLLLVSL